MGESYRFLDVPVGDAQDYVKDKERSCKAFATYFLLRCMNMLKYEGLPEEIPVDCMSKMLLSNGWCWFTKWGCDKGSDNIVTTKRLAGDKQFYVFDGTLGGVPDAYYRPTKLIVANPGAKCYEEYILNREKNGTYYGTEGVIIRNDKLYQGLLPIILRYSYLLAENVLTLHSADVWLRIIALISAPDDSSLASAQSFIDSVEKGKLSAVGESSFLDKSIKLQSPPSNNGSYLTQFIEYQQYFLGSFFNEIGLNANFNMKRESIAKSESSLNEDSMLPLCQNMLYTQQQDFTVVNEMFGLNIKVSFDSAWLQNALEIAGQLKEITSTLTSSSTPVDDVGSAISRDDGGDEEKNDEAAKESEGTEGMVGREAGSSGEIKTFGGSNNNAERIQGGSSDEKGQAEGSENENSEELVSDEGLIDEPELVKMIESASGITLDDSKESEENKDESEE